MSAFSLYSLNHSWTAVLWFCCLRDSFTLSRNSTGIWSVLVSSTVSVPSSPTTFGALNTSVHLMIWMPYWLVTKPLT